MLLLLRGLLDGRFSGGQKTIALEGGHEDLAGLEVWKTQLKGS